MQRHFIFISCSWVSPDLGVLWWRGALKEAAPPPAAPARTGLIGSLKTPFFDEFVWWWEKKLLLGEPFQCTWSLRSTHFSKTLHCMSDVIRWRAPYYPLMHWCQTLGGSVIIFCLQGNVKLPLELLARRYFAGHVLPILHIPECSATNWVHQSGQDIHWRVLLSLHWFIIIFFFNFKLLPCGKGHCWNLIQKAANKEGHIHDFHFQFVYFDGFLFIWNSI